MSVYDYVRYDHDNFLTLSLFNVLIYLLFEIHCSICEELRVSLYKQACAYYSSFIY